MIIKNKKVPIELLRRYFLSPAGFRVELRSTSEGWALDGSFAFPENFKQKLAFKRVDNKFHPLQNLSMALHFNYIKDAISTELTIVNNWIYYRPVKSEPISHKYRWLFNAIDNHFLTSAFPCWIPGNLEELTLKALAGFYQLNDKVYDSKNTTTQQYKIAARKDLESSLFYIYIVDKLGYEQIHGAGEQPLIAAYDLYEKIWKNIWQQEAPSITEIEGVIDIKKNSKGNFIFSEGDYLFENEYKFYYLGRNKEFNKSDCYRGCYKFLEGEFELFERPLFDSDYKIASVESLLKALEDGDKIL